MVNENTIVRTIASAQFPGVHLQMDGNGVNHSASGSGALNVGHGLGPLEQFKISVPPQDTNPYRTLIESVAYPGVYLRMDGSGVKTVTGTGGGIVNKQSGAAAYEWFILRPQTDGTYAIESEAFPGVFLRLSMEDKRATVNCQFGAGGYEKFRLETPPETPRLRVLTYNTHLMKDSFLVTGTDFKRAWAREGYAVFEDDERKEPIMRFVFQSLADIVSLQEVWAVDWQEYFANNLRHAYPYIYTGDAAKGLVTSTSGLVLYSKFDLSDRYFKDFPGMEFPDSMSNKGALGATADIPGFGKLRIGTAHTTGARSDVQFLVDKTINNSADHSSLPAIMMGDFNIGWTPGGTKSEYVELKRIQSFPGSKTYAASDAWIDVHGQNADSDPYTIKMRENTIHQLFSPERDTEPDDRMDYLWVKPSKEKVLSPVSASVPRRGLTYASKRWHWAHKNTVARMPAAAVLGDRLCVVSKDGGSLGASAGLLTAIFDQKTLKWVHRYTGFNTSAPPGIVAFGNKFHLFYRHGDGNAIFHRSSADGETWSDWVNVGFDTGGSVCPIVFNDKLYLFYVDSSGLGGRIFHRTRELSGDNWASGWSGANSFDVNTRSDISAAVLGDRLCVVAKDNDNADGRSSGVMYAVLDKNGGGWKTGHPDGLVTSGSPGIVAAEDRFQLYYRHNKGDAVFTAWSQDGQNWHDRDQNTMHDSMTGGVCPVFFQGKVWLFYPYLNTTGLAGGYYGDNTMLQTRMPDVQVDLSDHYPLLVDLEMKTRACLLDVMVHVKDLGDVTYRDNQWASIGGESRQIEGFQLNPLNGDLTLEYMAHIAGSGDSDWAQQGQFVGTRNQSKAVEGFAVRLTGAAASKYVLSYKAHLKDKGDTAFVGDGQFCGTRGESRSVEAIWIKLERK